MKTLVNRHDFIQQFGRNGLLAGMAALAVAALHGSKSPSECMNTHQCQTCNVHGVCTLPEKKEVPK
jgi:ferredoxin